MVGPHLDYDLLYPSCGGHQAMLTEESTNSLSTSAGRIPVAGLGHVLFSMTLISIGIVGLVNGGFTSIWTGVPRHLPARAVLANLCALVSLGSGIALLWHRTASLAARLFLMSMLVWLVLFRLPLFLTAPVTTAVWWAGGETGVMIAGSWLLSVWFTRGRDSERLAWLVSDRAIVIARSLYGLALIPFGIAHFTYLQRTVGMVPSWLPWHLAWAYGTGGSLIVAGTAILFGFCSRLAALLSAVELALFTLLVWGPVVLAGPSASQWNELLVSCALTASAFVVADSYRGRPWLSVGRS
jgi:uncharacterized membrane protein